MLYVLLYSTFWILGAIPARSARSASIHALLDSSITRQVHGIAMHSRKESPFTSAGSSGRLRVRHSAAATAEDHRCRLSPPRRPLPKCCSPRATQRHHPSERWSAPGYARQGEICRIPAELSPCIRWISRWQSCWAPCSWRPSSRDWVPDGKGLHKPCQLPARERIQRNMKKWILSRIKIRRIPGNVSHMHHILGKIQRRGLLDVLRQGL